jgi:tripartite-type tricarboxylate transporter receptor subunit TctC
MRCMRVLAVMLVLAGALPSTSPAQGYPDKPIRFLVPYPPGGGNDLPARIIGPELTRMWGQPVVIENRAGAAGTLGAGLVARAEPDGYTYLLTSASHAIAPSVMRDLPFDAAKDFAGVAMILTAPAILLVPAGSPLKSLQELIARAKAEPRRLTYATVGPGTSGHLVGLALEQAAGISLVHVPYKGGPQSAQALMAAEVDASVTILNAAMPMIRSGKARALALDERTSLLPDVPAFAELGLKDIVGKNWVALFAPAATPRAIVNRMNQAVSEIMRRPEIREKFIAMSTQPAEMAPEKIDAFVRDQVAYYRRAVERFKVPVER